MPRRIVAAAVPGGCRIIKHLLDAIEHAPCGDGFFLPYRLHDIEHDCRINVGGSERAALRKDVGLEARPPLRGVPWGPALLMQGHEGTGAFLTTDPLPPRPSQR